MRNYLGPPHTFNVIINDVELPPPGVHYTAPINSCYGARNMSGMTSSIMRHFTGATRVARVSDPTVSTDLIATNSVFLGTWKPLMAGKFQWAIFRCFWGASRTSSSPGDQLLAPRSPSTLSSTLPSSWKLVLRITWLVHQDCQGQPARHTESLNDHLKVH